MIFILSAIDPSGCGFPPVLERRRIASRGSPSCPFTPFTSFALDDATQSTSRRQRQRSRNGTGAALSTVYARYRYRNNTFFGAFQVLSWIPVTSAAPLRVRALKTRTQHRPIAGSADALNHRYDHRYPFRVLPCRRSRTWRSVGSLEPSCSLTPPSTVYSRLSVW